MALILNIDTATEVASICVSENGKSLAFLKNEHQKEHASFVHAAADEVLKEVGLSLKDIDAYTVTSGPGSYTGLRVGMATAKGFCYAFSKPLIAINTLEVMANAALETLVTTEKNALVCPMIDARRMEVFTAIYDQSLEIVMSPQPVILNEATFDNYITVHKIIFFGSGSTKLKEIKSDRNMTFVDVEYNAKSLGTLAEKAFQEKNFSDVSYSQPEYLKDFHTISKVKNV